MLYNEITNDEKNLVSKKLQNWFKVQVEVEAT